ncbi:MAG TPA: hypothetical protein VKU00_13225 [Chthonomonadaceae bacterium]|nr:hypothetical protein [Chthonomonadaceae bacterium]
MITTEQIKALAEVESDSVPVVSFYLDVDGRQRTFLQYVEVTHQLVRDARARLEAMNLPEAAAELARHDLDRISRYVGAEFKHSDERGLAIFASTARKLWQVYPLACPVEDRLILERRPYLRPLADLLDENAGALVVLVDREKARLFLVEMGTITELEKVQDDVPARVHPESWYGLSDKHIERHVDERIFYHLRHVAHVLSQVAQRQRLQRVLIGGAQDIVAEFQRVLPPDLAGSVIGKLDGLMLISKPEEILQKALQVLDQAKRRQEQKLVNQILEMAGPKGVAVLGLEPSLQALYHRAVHTLGVDKNLLLSGFQCPHCGRLFPVADPCPECGNTEVRHLDDLVEAVVEEAYRQDSQVTFLSLTSERSDWEGIGALLHFSLPGLTAPQGAGYRSNE